jgi:hypothetical protein
MKDLTKCHPYGAFARRGCLLSNRRLQLVVMHMGPAEIEQRFLQMRFKSAMSLCREHGTAHRGCHYDFLLGSGVRTSREMGWLVSAPGGANFSASCGTSMVRPLSRAIVLAQEQ